MQFLLLASVVQTSFFLTSLGAPIPSESTSLQSTTGAGDISSTVASTLSNDGSGDLLGGLKDVLEPALDTVSGAGAGALKDRLIAGRDKKEETAKVASEATETTGATGASVLTSQAYNDIQISSGTAGDAEAKAKALVAVDASNLAGVSAADLKIVQGVHDVAEDAEVEAFNPAIAAATGDAAVALQNGKIQNKVMKLTAEVLGLQIEQAQGGDVTDADITAEQTKLAKNIALDVAAAGQPSTAVPFTGTS